MSETGPQEQGPAAELIGWLPQTIASRIDQDQTEEIFTLLGLALWYARMTEQVIRSRSLALKLQPHEILDDPGEQMSEGR